MSRELRICPGVGDRKCGDFLSRLDRDPHPTCTRCRGKVCTKDLTCDFCAVWSAEQWELFAKKRSYKERKRPSGSVPPAQQTSPRVETSSGVSRPGTSSSSRLLGGQGKQEGSRGAPGVVLGGAPSPPARPRSSERGRPLSRVAHMTALGQAGDYLAPLPACGPRNQDGWPDEKPGRVWRRLPLSLLWFLKPRQALLLLQEERP